MIRIEKAGFLLVLVSAIAAAAPKDVDPADLEGCLDSDAKACARLCEAFKGKEWYPVQDPCKAGDALLCRERGALWEHGPCTARQASDAYDEFRYACEAKDADGCAEWMRLDARGNGIIGWEKVPARVRQYLPEACAAGSERGCTTLASLYAEGRFFERDEAKAAELFRKACDAGKQRACAGLADLLFHGRGVAADAPAGLAMAKAACDAGHPFGCEVQGRLVLEGGKKDAAKAVPLLRKACDGREGMACAALAKLYLDGNGVSKDEARALKILDESCDLTRDGESCVLLGTLKVRQKAGLEAAKEAFETACHGWYPGACLAGARLFLGAAGGGDTGEAGKLASAGCKEDDPECCALSGELLEKGTTAWKKNPVNAKGFHDKACKLGVARSCEAAKRLESDPAVLAAPKKPKEEAREEAPKPKPEGDLESRCLDGSLRACRELRDANGGEAGLPALRTACEKHEPGACRRLGIIIEGLGHDDPAALRAYRAGCDDGDQEACVGAGRMLESIGGRDAVKADMLYRVACRLEVARGCLHLGLELRDTNRDEDVVQSADLLRQACDAGVLPGCAELANSLFDGKGVKKDPAKAAALLRKSCDAGFWYGCQQLGLRTLDGSVGAKDPAKAAGWFSAACDLDDAAGCGELGLLRRDGEGVPEDVPAARELLRKACENNGTEYCAAAGEIATDPAVAAKLWKTGCDAKDADACEALATARGAPDPFSKPKRPANAAEGALDDDEKLCDAGSLKACKRFFLAYEADHGAPLEAACKAGDAAKCRRFAFILSAGVVVKRDLPRAASLYAKACDGGDERACEKLVIAYAGGHGVEKDPARAAAIAKRGCDAGQQGLCELLASFRLAGLGVAKDAAEAFRLAKAACESEARRACDIAGQTLMKGNGVAKDLEGARRLFERGCEGHDGRACNSLGVAYGEGIGTAKDDERAASAFRDGCAAGHGTSCRWLGFLYETGRAFAEHRGNEAELRYAEACDDGDGNGCLRLAAMLTSGKLVDQDLESAAEALGWGCERGEAAACTALGEAYAAGKGVKQDAAAAKKWRERGCAAGDKAACAKP